MKTKTTSVLVHNQLSFQTAKLAPTRRETKYIGSLHDESDGRKTNYIFLGDQRVASITDGETMYYHTDHLGGTNVLTDAYSNVKELIEYTPFGDYSRRENFGTQKEIAWYYYTGQMRDEESGLYFYNARYYNAKLGRFITADTIVQDPAGDPQTFNRYAYTGNNPVNRIDPSGNSWFKNLFNGTLFGGLLNAFKTGDWSAYFRQAAVTILSAAAGFLIPGGALFSNFFLNVAAHAVIGAAVGAVVGGFTSVIMGGNFSQGVTMGAISGAIGGAIKGVGTSEQFQNWRTHGKGTFKSNKEFARIQKGVSDLSGGITNENFRLNAEMHDFSLASGSGHSSLSIDDAVIGKWPSTQHKRLSWAFGFQEQGVIKTDSNFFGYMASNRIKINSYQNNLVQMMKSNPGVFNLSANCAKFTLDTARAIGLNVHNSLSTFGISNPAKIVRWLATPSSYQESSLGYITSIKTNYFRF